MNPTYTQFGTGKQYKSLAEISAAGLAPNTQFVESGSGKQITAADLLKTTTATAPAPLANPTPASTLTPPSNLNLPTPSAPEVQSQYFSGITGNVDTARNTLKAEFDGQAADQAERQKQLDAERKAALDAEKDLSAPFRANLEAAQAPKVNKNLDAAQTLVDELDALARQAGSILDSASGKYATVTARSNASKTTIADITARAGIIQAAISARYGQVGQIDYQIDRAVAATNADRQDERGYYETLLSLNKQGQLKLDSESKTLAENRVALLTSDLENAQKFADAIKAAMLDPDTAQAYAQAGVTLNDSPEVIGKKLADFGYSKEVSDASNAMAADGYTALLPGQKAPVGAKVITITDSRGKQKQFYTMGTSQIFGSETGGYYERLADGTIRRVAGTGGGNSGGTGGDVSPEGQALINAARSLRFNSVEESKRINGDVQRFVEQGDLEGATNVLRSFGYQKLPASAQSDYDLYDNAQSAFASAAAQLGAANISVGPYASLANNAAPWLGIKRDQQYVQLRDTIELGQAQLRKGFYGTAVTGTEAANAKNFLITDSDDIDTLRWKLENGANYLRFVNDAQISRATGLPKPDINEYITPLSVSNEPPDDDVLQREFNALQSGQSVSNVNYFKPVSDFFGALTNSLFQ